MEKFIIYQNKFLKKTLIGYFHQYYVGYNQPGNPDFLNILKDTYCREPKSILLDAAKKVKDILILDIGDIIKELSIDNILITCVPRAKALANYDKRQLLFKEAVKRAAREIGVTDGTDYIKRVKNTKTTHLRSPKLKEINSGPEPYPGINLNTCDIAEELIENKCIILIDDIYTPNINIDEDCIQALLSLGAKEVIFYSVAFTKPKNNGII